MCKFAASAPKSALGTPFENGRFWEGVHVQLKSGLSPN